MADDYRTESEHDCDRILYSSAFRRLAGVTQVVAVNEIQLFHNRLTHTQKVAQLARRVAQDLKRDKKYAPAIAAMGGLDTPAAEAAALAHDLGHPSFGHIAEEVLCECCDKAGADGFEGNAQSFRIVTKLARRASDEPGLGLHAKTLRGILKYPWLRGEDPGPDAPKEKALHYRKWGAYRSEQADFDDARGEDPSEEQSPEAAIMDWCDDISYALHDLEDFYRAHLIPLDRIAPFTAENAEPDEFLARASHELQSNPQYDPDKGAAALRHLRGYFPSSPYRGTHVDRKQLHTMTSTFIDSYIKATTAHAQPPWIRVSDSAKHEIMILKQLTWQYVVNSPDLATLQEGQKRIIGSVFDKLVDWIGREMKSGTSHRLPTRLLTLNATFREDNNAMDSLDTEEARCARVVADYLCSLTEEQVLNLHDRLSGDGSSSILEAWVRQ